MAGNCPACETGRYHTPADWVFHPDAGKGRIGLAIQTITGVTIIGSAVPESGNPLLSASGNPPGATEPRQDNPPTQRDNLLDRDGTLRRVAETGGGSPIPPPVPLPLIQYRCPECGGVERVTALMSIPFHKHPYGPGELQIAQIPLRRIQ